MKQLYSIILLSAILLSSCGGGHNCKDDCAANGLDENCCPKVDSTIKALDKPSIKKINIFFDASGSMTGYMPSSKPSSAMQLLIPDIISRLKTQYPNTITFYPIYRVSLKSWGATH
jgi:PBP1b-binding outer membrane lipoprotein LpoB